jgi:hypothetical protein
MRLVHVAVVVLAVLASCSFRPGSLADDADTQGGGDDAAPDAPRPIDAAVDAAPDAPPDAPPQPVTMMFPTTADTYVDSLERNTNFGSLIGMLVDGASEPATGLILVPLDAIPQTATVQLAVLHIWTGNNTGDTVQLYPMLEAWSETEATWNQRMNGTAWTTIGAGTGSRGATSVGSMTPNATLAERTVTLPTALVQGWVTAPATNYGLAIATAGANGSSWRTREDAATRRPYIEVTYVP